MPRRKLTVFIAISAVFVFLLISNFIPPAGANKGQHRPSKTESEKRGGNTSEADKGKAQTPTASPDDKAKAPLVDLMAHGQASTASASVEDMDEDQDDPDLPKRLLRNRIDKEEYLRLRDEYIGLLRGVEPGQPFNTTLRSRAIEQFEQQESASLKAAARSNGELQILSFTNWTEVGPRPVPNGQTQQFPTTAPVTGRATAVVVDPTDSNKVYLGAAQGGVWRSTNGGTTWTAIFDTAQSLSIGALALAPSDPTILYVGTGEPNNSADSYFGVGVYRIDNADTTATLVGPINPLITTGTTTALTYNCFGGRAISKILVDPTNPATIFVSTAAAVSGAAGNALSNTIPPLALRGVFRSTNATAAAASVTFSKLIVNTDGSLDAPGTGNTSIFDMVFEPGNPNNLLVTPSGAATGGGVWRSTNALAATPTFVNTLFPGFNGLVMHLAINKVGAVVTAYVGSNEPSVGAGCGSQAGRARKSTDGGVTWSLPLVAAEGYCGGQCVYDNPVGVDPTDASIVYIGGNASGTCSAVLKRSGNGGASFTADATGLHADSHGFAFDTLTGPPTTVWFVNDGGVWKRQDAPAGTPWLNENNAPLGTIQFVSLAVHPTDQNFTIGGTQDNGTEAQQTTPGNWVSAESGDGGFALIDQSATNTATVTMYHTFFNQTNNFIGFDRTNLGACLAVKDSWEFRGGGFANDPSPSCDGTAFALSNGINVADTVLFYAPMALGPGTPNTLYFGTNKLYRSTDRGDTMAIVSQNPLVAGVAVSAIGISPVNDNVRIVGLRNGAVFATTTGSTTLTNTAFPIPLNATSSTTNRHVARAVIDPTNSNTAYVTLAYYTNPATAGQIWRTTNLNSATPTWTSIGNTGTGLPNIPVNGFAVDANDPTFPGVSVLYAGTDIGVYASTDSGATWAPFGTGLPRSAVFDMAIQPTSRILRVATHGRGMWEIQLPAIDLTITKTHSGNFSQGQTGAQYTITVTNSGTASTSGTVTVTDTVPSGLTATGISGSGWTCTQPSGPCTRSDALAGSTSYPIITLTVDVANNAPASVTNSATVSGGGETNTGNDTANDLTTINAGPDLTITKAHSGNFSQGQTGATYTITVTNSGGTATSGTVTVTDAVPSGLTATAINGTGWTCTQPSGPCTRTDVLAASTSYPIITLTVDVANNAPASVTNTATVSGGGEVVTGNDTANDPTTIDQVADLTITKTHSGNFSQGQTGAQYTVTVTNSGSGSTSGTVTVTDTVPSGLTATAISGAGWTCTQPAGPCTRTDVLAASASYPVITLTVDVANSAPASVTNTATVSGGGEVVTGNDTANDPTTIAAGPDLTITKTHSGNFSQGQTGATYTITVTNSGGTATNGTTVTVSDTVPAGLTATVIGGTGWTCTQPSGPCTRTDVLAASASYPIITLIVDVANNAPTSVINTATVSGGGEVVTGNDTANDSTTIGAGPDLTITKTHSGNFSQGQTGAQYTITVTNSGGTPTNGTTVTVSDTAPAGLTATAISGTGWTCTQPSGPCTRTDVLAASGSYPVITLTVDVANNAPTSVINTATVSGGGEVVTGNDTANDSTTIGPGPDLTITKTHVGNFSQGQTGAQYTVTVTNSGSTPTSGTVTVTDTVPSGLTATAISGAGWTCTQPAGPCTRSDALAASASYPVLTLTVNVASNAPASVTNTATVSGGNESNTGNDTANDLTTINPVAGPDLTITKSHSGNFSQGQAGAQYTITVTNSGGTATSGTVTVTDTVPSGLTATAISGAGWTCTQPSGPCTRSDALAASASYPSITLTVNVASNAPASVTNTATVSGGNETNAGNDTANDLTTINPVAGADLTITKTHSGNFSQGQTGAQYTITVTNSGGTATSGTVTVTDTVPSGLTATAISGAGWSCTQPAGPCTRSDVLNPSSSYPVLTLTVNVASNAPASVTNTATVSGGGETNTGNDTANDLTTINPSSQTKADLDISKSDVSDPVFFGDNITYKIEVENNGPGKATGVTVTDTLPGNVNFVSASSGCSYNSGTVTCTIGSLAKDKKVTWTIVVHPNATGTYSNTATVTANEPDPKLSNNSDQETTKVVAATVGVASVSLNPSTVKGGNNVTGTVTLTAPAPSNTVVNLSSSNESVAKPTVSSITINANQTSKTFTVKTFSVSSTKTAKIKASANGTSKEATLTVTH